MRRKNVYEDKICLKILIYMIKESKKERKCFSPKDLQKYIREDIQEEGKIHRNTIRGKMNKLLETDFIEKRRTAKQDKYRLNSRFLSNQDTDLITMMWYNKEDFIQMKDNLSVSIYPFGVFDTKIMKDLKKINKTFKKYILPEIESFRKKHGSNKKPDIENRFSIDYSSYSSTDEMFPTHDRLNNELKAIIEKEKNEL